MINTKLDELFQRWRTEMEKDGVSGFSEDGLMYRNGHEDQLWNDSPRKIAFLLKENNNNDGEDVRAWSGSINGHSPNGLFFNRIAAWLYGITYLKDTCYPSIADAFNSSNQMKALQELPYAYVNVKKKSGGPVAYESQITDFAQRYAKYIREELDILDPNIIVCGGNTVFKIAKELIYPELNFIEKSSWTHQDQKKQITIINSFHPTAHKPNEHMYDWMMESLINNI